MRTSSFPRHNWHRPSPLYFHDDGLVENIYAHHAVDANVYRVQDISRVLGPVQFDHFLDRRKATFPLPGSHRGTWTSSTSPQWPEEKTPVQGCPGRNEDVIRVVERERRKCIPCIPNLVNYIYSTAM